MASRDKIYEALDIERKNQEFLEEKHKDIDLEIQSIESLVKQAKEQITYNQKLEKLKKATAIAIRCFEDYGIQATEILKKPKKILYR